MRRHRFEGRRAGFTLLEVLIACSFLGLMGANVFMAMNSSTRSFKAGSSRLDIEHQADQTLDRIALAIMGADRSTLYSPSEFPTAHSQMFFQRSLGYQVASSAPILSEQESIALDPGTSEVAWRVEPGTADEKRVLWTRAARQYLAGELPNGLDDNGNGLVDEKGLTFAINGDLITIQLTLEKLLDDGTRMPYTVQTQVTCRN